MSSYGWVIVDGVLQYNGTISTGGQVLLATGSAGAPSLAFTIDPTTGLFRPSVSAVTFVAAATAIFGYTSNTTVGVTLTAGIPLTWSSGTANISTPDVYLYRDAAATLALRNSTTPQAFNVYNTYTDASNFERGEFVWAGNVLEIGSTKLGTGSSRNIRLKAAGGTIILSSNGTDKYGFGASGVTLFAGLTTVALGNPAIVASGRQTAQAAAVASVATYTPAVDASFEVLANILVTAATSHTFTMTVNYTDESNAGRVSTFYFEPGNGAALSTSVVNTNGAVPYHGIPLRIRAKGGTAVTLATTGTFTTVTYNVEGSIIQIS